MQQDILIDNIISNLNNNFHTIIGFSIFALLETIRGIVC